MTDYLIKTDGTSSGLTLGAAISDTDAIELQQAFVAPASTLHQTFAAVKTWIKSWIVKGDVGLGNVANSLQLVAASNLSDLADADAARINLSTGYGAPRNRFYAFTDCVVPASGLISDHWVPSWSGASAAIAGITGLGRLGVISLVSGTTTTGRSSITDSSTSVVQPLNLGAGQVRFGSIFAIHTLSTGTETYTTRLGLIDSITGESTDGCFFRYTDGVNAGKWQAVTRSNGVETATAFDTGVTPVADTFQRFEIVVNAAGTSVTFYIDGALVATSAANIPTGAARSTGYGVMSLKSAGTTSTSCGYIDYMEVEQLFTSAR